MAHTSLYLSWPLVVVHITAIWQKTKVFFAYFSRILRVVSKFQTVNPRCPPSQAHTFSVQLLFDETFAQHGVFAVPCRSAECVLLHCFNAQPYIFALVNYADVALSVFYSRFNALPDNLTVMNGSVCSSVECCVFFRSPNLERW